MSHALNIEKWMGDENSVAAVVPGDALFGLLKRSFDLPAAFAARSTTRDGAQHIHAAGEEIPGDRVVEVLFVRSQPIHVTLRVERAASADKYLCEAEVSAQVRVLTERRELDAFRDRVMASHSAVSIRDIERYLQPAIDQALRELVQGHNTAALIDGDLAEPVAVCLSEALKAPCFAGGLAVEAGPFARFESEAYAKVRHVEEQAARELGEHEARRELREAISTAQRDKLEHLEGMLTKLRALAEGSPDVGLGQLMRAFNESQRGQLYQALFESRAKSRVTQWVTVVAGKDVLFFDPRSPERPARRVRIEGEAGGLRSVRVGAARGGGGEPVLLIGGACGVYEMPVGASEPSVAYLFHADESVRGGVNAAAAWGDDLLATHSELGILHWRREAPDGASALLHEMTTPATAVRNAQFAAGRFWCTVDERVVSLPVDGLSGEPVVMAAGRSVLTALCADAVGLHAGNCEGEVFFIPSAPHAVAERIHAGNGRSAESVALLTGSGINRLFFTDTSLAVHSRVLGDTFGCRYEAGGQTIRRAVAAEDVVAGTTDARDRVILWSADRPEKPSEVIAVSQLTGHSVQDVCLVPIA